MHLTLQTGRLAKRRREQATGRIASASLNGRFLRKEPGGSDRAGWFAGDVESGRQYGGCGRRPAGGWRGVDSMLAASELFVAPPVVPSANRLVSKYN